MGTQEILKKSYLMFLTMWLAISTLGCATARLRKSPEFWLIEADEVDPVLYRRKNEFTEQVITIKGNKEAMKQFMCVPSKEIDYLIDGVIDAKTK